MVIQFYKSLIYKFHSSVAYVFTQNISDCRFFLDEHSDALPNRYILPVHTYRRKNIHSFNPIENLDLGVAHLNHTLCRRFPCHISRVRLIRIPGTTFVLRKTHFVVCLVALGLARRAQIKSLIVGWRRDLDDEDCAPGWTDGRVLGGWGSLVSWSKVLYDAFYLLACLIIGRIPNVLI